MIHKTNQKLLKLNTIGQGINFKKNKEMDVDTFSVGYNDDLMYKWIKMNIFTKATF